MKLNKNGSKSISKGGDSKKPSNSYLKKGNKWHIKKYKI